MEQNTSNESVKWTERKDKLLLQLSSELPFDQVAETMNWTCGSSSFTADNCQEHCIELVKKRTKRQFAEEEDKLLSDLVNQLGKQWDKIAEVMGTRTARECRERWENYLNPSLNPEWTPDEDAILMDLYKKHGKKWGKIAVVLENKTVNGIKNRVRILMKQQDKKESLLNDKISNAIETSKQTSTIETTEQTNAVKISEAPLNFG